MPIYEYECEACGERFEVIQKFSDPSVDTCTKCGKGPVKRLLSSPAIQFKGSGWYITDYARKENSKSQSPNSKSQAGESKSEGGDSKSETPKSEASKSETSKSETTKSDSAKPKAQGDA